MSKTIKLKDKEYEELNKFAGMLRMKKNKPVSLGEAIEELLKKRNSSSPLDFAGKWDMTEKEAKELRKDLDKLWKTWKLK